MKNRIIKKIDPPIQTPLGPISQHRHSWETIDLRPHIEPIPDLRFHAVETLDGNDLFVDIDKSDNIVLQIRTVKEGDKPQIQNLLTLSRESAMDFADILFKRAAPKSLCVATKGGMTIHRLPPNTKAV